MFSSLLTTFIVFVLGAAIGSFLNVVIYRVPAGLSLLHPPSRCPRCSRRLKAYDNVPILGWLWLKGRCRYCCQPIAIRYPCIEAITGILFVGAFWAFHPSWLTVSYWVFFSWLLALAFIDLDTMTLPNSLTQSGLVIGLVLQAIVGGTTSSSLAGAATHLWSGLLGAVVGIWLFDAITLLGSIAFGQTVMGGGDAKLAALMGAWLGWKYLLLASFLGCVLGAGVGSGAMALHHFKHQHPIPFGPFLALGALITIFWGEAIVSTYVRIFFPTL